MNYCSLLEKVLVVEINAIIDEFKISFEYLICLFINAFPPASNRQLGTAKLSPNAVEYLSLEYQRQQPDVPILILLDIMTKSY